MDIAVLPAGKRRPGLTFARIWTLWIVIATTALLLLLGRLLGLLYLIVLRLCRGFGSICAGQTFADEIGERLSAFGPGFVVTVLLLLFLRLRFVRGSSSSIISILLFLGHFKRRPALSLSHRPAAGVRAAATLVEGGPASKVPAAPFARPAAAVGGRVRPVLSLLFLRMLHSVIVLIVDGHCVSLARRRRNGSTIVDVVVVADNIQIAQRIGRNLAGRTEHLQLLAQKGDLHLQLLALQPLRLQILQALLQAGLQSLILDHLNDLAGGPHGGRCALSIAQAPQSAEGARLVAFSEETLQMAQSARACGVAAAGCHGVVGLAGGYGYSWMSMMSMMRTSIGIG